MYTDHEDALKSLQSKTAEHYIMLICMHETKLCSRDDIRDHTLADFNLTDATGGGAQSTKDEM